VVSPPVQLHPPAPFDVGTFFDPLPAADDAAPLYLEALSEFDPMMAECWPQEERGRPQDDLRERTKRLRDLCDEAERNPDAIGQESLDQIVAAFLPGWEKIVAAQERPKCRFRIGLEIGAPVPHVFAARQVGRVGQLMATSDLRKGNIDQAINRFEIVLRLARDVRPGGNEVCQIGSVAIESAAIRNILLPILGSTFLRAPHCDRLIAVLRTHEQNAVEPFREMLRPAYFAPRLMMEQLRSQPAQRKALAELLKRDATGALDGLMRDLVGDRPPDPEAAKQSREAGEELARMTDADFAKAIGALNDYFGSLIGLNVTSYSGRAKALPELASAKLGTDSLVDLLTPGKAVMLAMASLAAQDTVYVHACQALVALRRWQLQHGALPADLGAAVSGAGFPEIPRDPFSEGSLNLKVINGDLAVYSIGPDQKDDRGEKDAEWGRRQEGDWILKMPLPSSR
jgi:hypothetical protein